MYLTIIRYSTTDESTLGALLIDGNFACYTIEDPYNSPKIKDNTRIPGGIIYKLGLYRSGRLHSKYSENYPGIHHGMIQVLNVPEFENILFHIGNHSQNTSGCILLGDKANNNTTGSGLIENSRTAYIRVYPRIAGAIVRGEKTTLLIRELQELIKFEPFREGKSDE